MIKLYITSPVGCREGLEAGCWEGSLEGCWEGCEDGWLGLDEGCSVGWLIGCSEGWDEGVDGLEVGCCVGFKFGCFDGWATGWCDGLLLYVVNSEFQNAFKSGQKRFKNTFLWDAERVAKLVAMMGLKDLLSE